MLPQELGLSDTRRTRFHFAGVRQFTFDSPFALSQLFQQCRSDGQTVATCQFQNFADVTEACAHNHGFITVLFVVLVDFRYRNHARIFCRSVLFLITIRFVPVKNTANKWRDQEHACFRTSTSLSEGEQQCQVTVNTFFFQLFCSTDTLPGRSQFDQNTIVANPCIVVEFDQAFCFRN